MIERESKPTILGQYWLVIHTHVCPILCSLCCTWWQHSMLIRHRRVTASKTPTNIHAKEISHPYAKHYALRTQYGFQFLLHQSWDCIISVAGELMRREEEAKWEKSEDRRGLEARNTKKGEKRKSERYADRHSELFFLASTTKQNFSWNVNIARLSVITETFQ